MLSLLAVCPILRIELLTVYPIVHVELLAVCPILRIELLAVYPILHVELLAVRPIVLVFRVELLTVGVELAAVRPIPCGHLEVPEALTWIKYFLGGSTADLRIHVGVENVHVRVKKEQTNFESHDGYSTVTYIHTIVCHTAPAGGRAGSSTPGSRGSDSEALMAIRE